MNETLRIKLKYGPKVCELRGTPEDLLRLVRYAHEGAVGANLRALHSADVDQTARDIGYLLEMMSDLNQKLLNRGRKEW